MAYDRSVAETLWRDYYSAGVRELAAQYGISPEWVTEEEFVETLMQGLRKHLKKSEALDDLSRWLDDRCATAKYWAGFWSEECMPI